MYPHKEVVKAYLEGKTVQFKNSSGEWEDIEPVDLRGDMPFFSALGSYRIKPQEVWVNLYDGGDGKLTGAVHPSEEAADYGASVFSKRLGGKAHKIVLTQ